MEAAARASFTTRDPTRATTRARSYHAEDHREDTWENASQSLGAREDYDNAAYYGEDAELHNDHYGDPAYQVFQAMIDEGLDETDQEAFYARQKAQETGHYGFWSQGRSYEVRGNLTLEEKKTGIQAMNAQTTCRRCDSMDIGAIMQRAPGMCAKVAARAKD